MISISPSKVRVIAGYRLHVKESYIEKVILDKNSIRIVNQPVAIAAPPQM